MELSTQPLAVTPHPIWVEKADIWVGLARLRLRGIASFL